jgi:ribosome maturation factor RimP
MNRELFVRNVGKYVTIALKPDNFKLTGTIDNVFEDCIEFTTTQKSSYIDIDRIGSLIVLE